MMSLCSSLTVYFKYYVQMGVHDVTVIGAPPGQEESHQTLVTPEAVQFVAELTNQFEAGVDQVGRMRMSSKLHFCPRRTSSEMGL